MFRYFSFEIVANYHWSAFQPSTEQIPSASTRTVNVTYNGHGANDETLTGFIFIFLSKEFSKFNKAQS